MDGFWCRHGKSTSVPADGAGDRDFELAEHREGQVPPLQCSSQLWEGTSPHSALLWWGHSSSGQQQVKSSSECDILCCVPAQSQLFRDADEWKSREKQMSYCLSDPACKEAGISVLYIKATLDPV